MIEAIACGPLGFLHQKPSNGRLGDFSAVASRTTKAETFPEAELEARKYPEVLRFSGGRCGPSMATRKLMRRRPNISEALSFNFVCNLRKPDVTPEQRV